MASWISNPELLLAALFGAAILLSVSLGQAASFRDEEGALTNWTRMPVLEESVVVSAPRGYCIDPLASLSAHRAAFVLMASCRSLTGDRTAAQPEIPGLLTTSIDARPGQFPTQQELSSFFGSRKGRAALSRSGDPEAMELGAMFSRGGVLFLRADERGAEPALGGSSWRAVFELDGMMVTATMRDLAGQPVGNAEGFRMVEQLVDAIRAANPGSAKSPSGTLSMK